MAICSCSSWLERPSNWSIGCGEEEEAKEEEEGGRRETPKKGKPVLGFCSRQQREAAILNNVIVNNSPLGLKAKL